MATAIFAITSILMALTAIYHIVEYYEPTKKIGHMACFVVLYFVCFTAVCLSIGNMSEKETIDSLSTGKAKIDTIYTIQNGDTINVEYKYILTKTN